LKSGLHPTLAGVLIAFTIPLNRRIHVTTFNDKMKRNLSAFCGEGFDEKTTLTHRQIESIDNMAEEIRHVHSPLQFLEHSLHRFVTFIVMPVFALANAGVVINGAGESGFMNILSLNIEVSLLAGKVLGILSFCWLAVKLGLASIPENVTWGNMLGIGFLGGMGFTMSLFISNLAFPDALFLNPAKIGILVGSFMAGILGYIILRYSLRKKLI
jgi:NhaA family Na+:H+ antiporter